MCWISKKLKVKIAKKDIPIWKVVCYNITEKKYISPFKGFYYIQGERYSTQMIFSVDEYFKRINGLNGFHSFSNKVYYQYFGGDIEIYIEGFFQKIFIYNIDCKCRENIPVIAYGHLPKGTNYAINKNGEIISNSIILDEFIRLE